MTHVIHDTSNVTECGSYKKWNRTFTESGTYTNTSVSNACTTQAVLNLTIKPNTRTIEQTSCDSYTWPLTGITYTGSGNPTARVDDTVAGCTMTITLNLTIKQSPKVTIKGPRAIEPGTSTTLVATPEDANANYSYLWTVGENTYTTNSIELTNLTENTDVHLLSTNRDGGCQSNNWITVTPYEGALTGIDGVNTLGVSLYPNPAVRFINLQCDEAIAHVEVYNLIGQQLISKQGNSNTMSLDLNSLANGHYTLRVVSHDGRTSMHKIIVNK